MPAVMPRLSPQLWAGRSDLGLLGRDRDYESQTTSDFFFGVDVSPLGRLRNHTASSAVYPADRTDGWL